MGTMNGVEKASEEEIYLAFMVLRFCSSIFPSIGRGRLSTWILMVFVWGSIIAMLENDSELICCIHENVCHWCQHIPYSMKITKVIEEDVLNEVEGLWVEFCTLTKILKKLHRCYNFENNDIYEDVLELSNVF